MFAASLQNAFTQHIGLLVFIFDIIEIFCYTNEKLSFILLDKLKI